MWRRYLRFWGDDAPSDIDNEISFHLEELVKHLKARGLSEDEARSGGGATVWRCRTCSF